MFSGNIQKLHAKVRRELQTVQLSRASFQIYANNLSHGSQGCCGQKVYKENVVWLEEAEAIFY